MSERINRREFSGLMAGGMALLSEAAPAWAQPAGTISVRQTADTKRFAEEPVLKWQPAEGSSAETIVLDPSRTYQEMLGFGGALTDASAYMINQLDAAAREKFLHELYRFSIDHDKQYILPQLRIARKYNPDLYVLASPWSPPGWMKANGTMLGGSLKPKSFPVYARGYSDFRRMYDDKNVDAVIVATPDHWHCLLTVMACAAG